MIDESDVQYREQLNGEWLALASTREVLKLAKGNASYKEALNFGADIMPEILGEDSLLRKNQMSPEARYWTQKANGQRQSGAVVTPQQLIKREIDEHTALIKSASRRETDSLRKKLKDLQRVLAELDVERHEEGALIIRDAYEVDRQLPGMPNATKGRGFKDVYLSNKEILRVRVFHPEKAEGITGADIVYEKHYRGENRARIAAVQYKLWDDKELRIDQRTKGQIERMKGFFCDQKACLRGNDIEYRFPHCAAFFRPTDKLQNADQELRTTGEHIPICEIDNLKFIGPKGGEYLRYEDIRHVSLNHDVFEDLFTNEKVGSRSLSYEELEGLYKKIAAYIGDIEHNTLIYHAQRFNLTDD